jgi:hypothetical protein
MRLAIAKTVLETARRRIGSIPLTTLRVAYFDVRARSTRMQ